jgi:hypothetical protein
VRRRLIQCAVSALAIISIPGAAGSTVSLTPLCELQARAAIGNHSKVRVPGTYLAGLEGDYLVDARCSQNSTRVEFALTDHRNWNKLQSMISRPYGTAHISGDGEPVMVIFEGEFYGPPLPDANLPEEIRKNYHPGWDSNSTTKLVVQSIQSVEDVPADNPCAPPKAHPTQWPCFQHHPQQH